MFIFACRKRKKKLATTFCYLAAEILYLVTSKKCSLIMRQTALILCFFYRLDMPLTVETWSQPIN